MSDLNEVSLLAGTMSDIAYVFELPSPDDLPKGFLFGGGKPVTALLVDWFNPFQVPDEIDTWEKWESGMKDFLLKKRYVRPGRTYCVMTGCSRTLAFVAPGRQGEQE